LKSMQAKRRETLNVAKSHTRGDSKEQRMQQAVAIAGYYLCKWIGDRGAQRA